MSTNIILKHKSSRVYNSLAISCNSLLTEAERQHSFSFGVVQPQDKWRKGWVRRFFNVDNPNRFWFFLSEGRMLSHYGLFDYA